MLNMDKWVSPNHFNVSEFEAFSNLAPAAEFDLVAPVMAYFYGDLRLRSKAKTALQELKKLKHPMVEDRSLAELLQTAPSGLVNRYTALVMALVEQWVPGTPARIDTEGAFAFTMGEDTNVLCGDQAGTFAYYTNTQALRERIDLALEG